MKPAPFTYQRPTSIADAVDALSEYGDEATILAGGQSLIPTMNVRTATPDTVIDINRIEALDYVCETEDEVRIGAMTRQSSAISRDFSTVDWRVIAPIRTSSSVSQT